MKLFEEIINSKNKFVQLFFHLPFLNSLGVALGLPVQSKLVFLVFSGFYHHQNVSVVKKHGGVGEFNNHTQLN